jgi:formylglycine-generating enzyme required for sulfatase activity
MTFSFVPPGSFLMGCETVADERPVHAVTLTRGFYLGVHPVTQSQWRAVTGTEPSHAKGRDRPVETVSWDDCQAFCAALRDLTGRGARLPTEAEWECAGQAGTTTEYHAGDGEAALGKTDWYHANASRRSKRVGRLPGNAWGLRDVHGNVCEWCSDWYAPYAEGSATDPRGPESGTDRVVRGGAWRHPAICCRVSFRFHIYPAYTSASLGLRVALDLPG